jgi:hypothetical protein
MSASAHPSCWLSAARPDGGRRHGQDRLAQCREWRVGEREQGRVVVAEHGDAGRIGQAAGADGPDRAERHQVGAADDAGDAPVEQPGGRGMPTLDAEQRQLDGGLQPVLGERAAVALDLALYR